MFTRRLIPEQFQKLFETLCEDPGRDMGAPYLTVSVNIDGCAYSLDLHPDNGNQVTIPQGARARYVPGGPRFAER